jgi:hypothetical protein
MHLHLTDRASDLRPQQVHFLIQPVQGKGAQGGIRLGKKADYAGGGGEADHRGMCSAVVDGMRGDRKVARDGSVEIAVVEGRRWKEVDWSCCVAPEAGWRRCGGGWS